ncbi:MAG: flagellar export protein FliJ [Lentisphaerae bacterium GWF2_44_16]|nr:MAG: flagellar export protein FliJ [Lentisphaerae bacterium GWF2_44_16]
MKKFNFTMQSILNVKITLKEARQAELAEARNQLMLQEKILEAINEKIKEAMAPHKMPEQNTASYFVQRERYIRRLKEMRKKQRYIVEQAETKVDKCITALKEALIEQKKMEKAKEREHSSWHKEFLKEEQKITDETGTAGAFFRNFART